MFNKECNLALNTLSQNKSKSVLKHASEDATKATCEQDFVENSRDRLYENSRHTADEVECAIYRPKSPSPRPQNNPKLSRGRPYNQWKPTDSIRKTRSTALPSAIQAATARTNRQSRIESASTPELADNGGAKDQDFDEKKFRNYRREVLRLNRAAICYDNIRWICVFLNFVILILSFLYFGSAIAFMYSKDILLLVMKSHAYNFLIFFFHTVSFLFWALSLSGLYFLWKKPRKIKTHALMTLIFGIASTSIIFLQNSTQKHIEENAEMQLISSINISKYESNKTSWNYLHDTFKCCGVTGFFDWCYQTTFYSNIRGIEQTNYPFNKTMGSSLCSIPDSCCTNRGAKIVETNKSLNCIDLLRSEEIPNVGCINFIKREISHLGRMYRVITGCGVGALTLLTVMSTSLFTFFLK